MRFCYNPLFLIIIHQRWRLLIGPDLPLRSTRSKELVLRKWEKPEKKVLDLPGEIQSLIFHNPSYTEYFDRWIQRMMIIANGEDIEYKKIYGEKTLRVFEPHCSFPGLIYIPEIDYGISKQSMNGDWKHYDIGNPEIGAQLF
jgi:hypothetical protein